MAGVSQKAEATQIATCWKGRVSMNTQLERRIRNKVDSVPQALAALARMGEHAPAYIYLAFPFAAAIIYRTLARTITIPMCRQMRRQSATSLTCSISIRGMTTRRRSVINLSELSPPWSSRLTLLCCAWSDNTLCAQRANYDMAARLLARVAGDVDQNLRRLWCELAGQPHHLIIGATLPAGVPTLTRLPKVCRQSRRERLLSR